MECISYLCSCIAAHKRKPHPLPFNDMTILHIINSLFIGGAERLITELLPAQQAAGHDVSIALLESADSDFERKLKESGIHTVTLNLPSGRYSPLNIMRLARLMEKADVVHTHLFPSQYWAALARLCCKKSRRPILVTTEHNTFNTRGRFALTSWLDRRIYALYDGIICISSATADFMRPRTPERVQLRVIENGVSLPSDADLSAPIPRREDVVNGVKSTDFMLLQVARFEEQKNQDCVIRALPLLPPDVHAVFAGKGSRMEICQKLAHDLGVADRTHFLGVRSDVARLWRVADAGVMSSHWEGFGLAAVEGMAYCRPVLASRVSGLADVVERPELLFTPDDHHDLADHILRLRNEQTLRTQLGEWGHKRAQCFSMANMAENYLKFYAEMTKPSEIV